MESLMRPSFCLASLALFSLFETAACESLWGGFRDPYPGNCGSNPNICAAGSVCNMETRLCESRLDMASPDAGTQPAWCKLSGPQCSRDGFCMQPAPVQTNLAAVAAVSGTSA